MRGSEMMEIDFDEESMTLNVNSYMQTVVKILREA